MMSAVRRSLATWLSGYIFCTLLACTGNVPQSFNMPSPTEVGTTTTAAVTAVSGGTVRSSGGTASVTIPAGALAGNVNVTVTVKDASAAPTPQVILSSVYDLGPTGTQFLAPVTLAFKAASTAPTGQKPVLAFLNTQSQWQVVPNSSFDSNTMTVSGQVDHFTDFAVIYVAVDGSGCAASPDPNAYCSPLSCDSVNDKCVTPVVAPTSFLVGGVLSGLVNGSVVLENNGGDLLTLTQNGNFTFATALDDGAGYLVAVAQPPANQVCTVAGATGNIAGADIGSVQVTCLTAYNVGGTVVGLTGVAVLQDGNTQIAITSDDANFIVENLPVGSAYNVSVLTQPDGQRCNIANGVGTVGQGDVNNIVLTCTTVSYPLGGHVAGLVADANVTLQNGVDSISVGNGAYTFPTALTSNASYAVTITSPNGQTCMFAPNVVGQGAMVGGPVNTIDVVCVPQTFSLGGAVSGILGNANLVLTNGADSISVTNGNYSLPTPVAYTADYNVGIVPPLGQVCAAASPNSLAGTMPDAALANLDIVCTVGSYPVGGTITGLVANTNVTLSNGADTIDVGGGDYAFPTLVAFMGPYNVSIVASPAFQTCTFADPSTSAGTMLGDGVTNVNITCTAQAFSLGGGVTGLADGTQVTVTNGADSITTGNGNFTFATPVPYGDNFNIGITSPDGQTCAFSPAGSGDAAMPAADLQSLSLVCAPTQYALGGTISGLVSNTNITLTNGADTLSVANGNYAFPTTLLPGADYNVTLVAPIAQTCGFTSAGVSVGTMVTGGVFGVNVACVPASFKVGGSVSGLIGNSSLGILDGIDTINANNGAYTLPTPVIYGSALSVSVNPPVGQTCTFGNGNTTLTTVMGHSDLTNVNISCAAITYPVGGFVTGLVNNAQVTLQSGGDSIQTTNGTYVFPTNVAYNSGYNVTLTSPAGQSCTFTGAHTGTMGAGAINNIGVSCVANGYSLGGQITGLQASTSVTVRQGGDALTLGNGNYTLPTAVQFGATYDITVSQPVGQSCVFADGNTFSTASMPATNIVGANITCGPSLYTLGGTVTGLVAGNLVQLQNGNDTIAVSNGRYTFPNRVAYNATYNATLTSPNGELCTFVGVHSGTMGAGNMTGADVFCAGLPYPLGGHVSGLVNGTTVILRNAGDSIGAGNGNFVFPTQVVYNTYYSASLASPAGQTCVFSPANSSIGAMPAGAVNSINVTCGPQTYTLGGSVSGLVANANVTLQNGSDTVAVSNGAYTFDVGLPYSTTYAVSVQSPTGQTCAFTGNHNGTMGAANITNVNLVCTPMTYALGGTVSGLVGAGKVSLVNGGDNLALGNGNYTFPTQVAYAAAYAASLSAPAGQSCAFVPGNSNAGVMPAGAVTTVNVVCGPQTYGIGGVVSGLLSDTNVTLQNGNDTVVVSNGTYGFPTGLAFNSNYSASLTSPDGQSCVFAGAAHAGVMGAANITGLNVVCTTLNYALGGTVSGLVGSTTVTLQQGGDSIAVGNGNFTFPTVLAYNSSYAATLVSPAGQSCAYTPPGSGAGTMPASDVTTLTVSCGPQTYTLGGSISGLVSNTNVTLANGNDTVAAGNGLYTFPTGLTYGSTYAVSLTSPAGQWCAFVGGHSGTMGAANVTNVGVNCTPSAYNLGGSVSGLVGNGAVTLQNGGDSIAVGNGNYLFPTQIIYAAPYAATITSPAGQTCVFSPHGAGNGTMPAGDLTNINVSCGPQTYNLGGNVTGLAANTNVTLQNGNDTLLTGNGPFTFDDGLQYNTPYAVSLTSPDGQSCAFVGGHAGTMGAANISSISVSCMPQTYVLGGSVSGLVGSGSVALQNGGDNLALGNGSYSFPTQVAYGASYAVSLTAPSGQSCAFSPLDSNAGVMPASSVGTVNVVCGAQTYGIGGVVSGLLASTQVTLKNGADSIAVGNGTYGFPTGLAFNSNYNASLVSPDGQTCNFFGAAHAGVMGAANIANLNVSCSAQTFTLGGTVAGLVGSSNVVLQQGSDSISVGNGGYTFPTAVAYGTGFAASLVSPSGQSCAFDAGSSSGTVPANNVTSINVTCGAQTYTLGGSVSGLVANTNLTLANGSDTVTVPNGLYTFPTALPFGNTYAVSLVSPDGQACSFVGGHAGTMGAANITNIGVSCVALSYSVGGTVSGLVGSGTVTLQSGGDSIAVGNGNYTFPTQLAYATHYNASLTSPAGQTCVFSPLGVSVGTVPASNVTNIDVSCGPQTYTLGGSVSGLVQGANVTLQNGNDTILTSNGAYTFPTGLQYNTGYAVTLTSPAGETCNFTGGHTGTMGAANISNIGVACVAQAFNLGGAVTGLVGSGTVNLQNGGDSIAVGNGAYTFPTAVAFDANYGATLTSPAGQTCVFSPPSVAAGVMPAGDVNTINVSCGPQTYTLGGTVVGLIGGTQVSLANGNDSIAVGSGPFTFPTGLAYNTGYNAIISAPTGQSCVFTSGHTGTMGAANVTSLRVSCSTMSFALGGTVSGLIGNSVVDLQNGADAMAVPNGTYTFATPVPYAANFSAAVTAPAGQDCDFSPSGSNLGTMPGNDVTTLNVVCTPHGYSVGGTVSGLVAGAQVTLQNGNDSFASGNGAFAFPTAVAYAASYNAALTSPAGEVCAFSGAHTGTVGAANVTSLVVTCTASSYSVGGTISGLVGNTQVTLTNGADTVTPGNGSFTFPTAVAFGAAYNATLTSPAGQTCSFSPTDANAGTMPAASVSSVNVVCGSQTYTLGGNVAGLLDGTTVNLQSGADSLDAGNGSYTFPTPLLYSAAYNVTATAPVGQSCAFNGASSGTMGAGNITNVNLSCTTLSYALGGVVSGLIDMAQVSLQNGNDAVSVTNGNYTFPTAVAYEGSYNVSLTSPAGHACGFSPADGNTGTMPAAAVSSVNVACVAQSYTLGGAVSGLVGGAQVSLQNGADTVTVGNGPYTFPTAVAFNANYAVTLSSPPGQSCSFTGASDGIMPTGSVSSINVNCSTSGYTLGGAVAGLVNNAEVTLQNGSDQITAANGPFTFPTQVAYLAPYAVSLTSPAGHSCGFSPADSNAGTMPASNVTSVQVVCTAQAYTLGGSVSGLVAGGQVTLQNGNDSLTVGNGSFSFPTQVAYNAGYQISVTSPGGQSCDFTPAGTDTGVMPATDVTSLAVTCTPQAYNVGGTVSGLLDATEVTLQNGGDTVTVANGPYTFPTPVANNANYSATLTSPVGQSCTFTGAASGTMGSADITNLDVACTPQSFNVGGTISGLVGGLSVLLQNGADNVTFGNGSYSFPTPVASGGTYDVTLTSPVGQVCAFANNANTGTVGSADVTDVDVDCTPATYNLGGTVSGLLGSTTVVLQSGGDSVTVPNGSYTFPTQVAYNSAYSVTLTAPNGQSCVFTPSNIDGGTMPASDVTNVDVACIADSYVIGGTVTGLAQGTQVVLGNGSDSVTVGDNNAFTFPTSVANLGYYDVVITSQPQGSTCTVTNGQGSVAGADVTNVAVSCAPTPSAGLTFTTNQAAITVLGQLDFGSNGDGTDDSTLSNPLGSVFAAPNGDLYIADTEHLRVVGYHQGVPADPGTPFDFEIGQADLFTRRSWTTPAADKYYPRTITGNNDVLVITDGFDNRVLILNTFPETTVDADVVLGQPDFTSNGSGCAPDALNGPRGASATASQLLVADALNNRVLIWNSIPNTAGQEADLALGQPDLGTCDTPANNGSAANTLTNPWDVWSDGTRVIVADTGANRVLVWNTFPTTSGQNADAVIGQPDWTTNVAGPVSTALGSPSGVTTDGQSIFIAEYDNIRVGQWTGVPWQGATPTLTAVLGEPDVNTTSCNPGGTPSETTLCQVGGVSLVGTQLLVADTINNRILVYQGQ